MRDRAERYAGSGWAVGDSGSCVDAGDRQTDIQTDRLCV